MNFFVPKNIFSVFLLILSAGLAVVNAQTPESKKQVADTPLDERVILYTDREIYLCGENIVFSANTYDGNWYMPLNLSSVLYVELYIQDNNVVFKGKFDLINGTTSGIIPIPKTVSSDIFFIRAYTNFMKNSGMDQFFVQKLKIINPFFNYTAYSRPLIEKQVIKCSIFPEGGKFIAGLKNNAACRFTDNSGKEIPAIARIIDSNDSIITEFKTYKKGFAGFSFVPEKDMNYFIEATSGTSQMKMPLPDILHEGISLTPDTLTSEFLRLGINSAGNFGLPLMLSARHGRFLYPLRETFISNAGTYDIPLQKIPKGLIILELSDFEGKLVSSRAYHNPSEKIILQLNTDKQKYQNRELVELVVNAGDNGLSAEADLVVSVTLADSIPDAKEFLPDAFILNHELKQIEGYDNDLIINAVSDKKLLDLVLLSVRSEKPSIGEFNLVYLPERNGDVISGTLITEGARPGQGIEILQSFIGKSTWVESAITNEKGEFSFINQKQHNKGDLILKVQNTESPAQIKINEEFFPEFPEPTDEILYLTKEELNLIAAQFINIQVDDVFKQAYNTAKEESDTVAFYGRDYDEYLFNEYYKLPNMREFIFEVVKGVIISKDNKEEFIEVLEENTFRKLGPRPLITIDGVPVTKTSMIVDLAPKNVKFIRVLRYKYFYKEQTFDGVVDIMTYTADASAIELPPNTFRYRTPPLSVSDVLVDSRPVPEEIGRIPVYKNLVYWNSSIKADSTGKKTISFYTPDNDGTFRIRCLAKTAGGVSGTADIYIRVGE